MDVNKAKTAKKKKKRIEEAQKYGDEARRIWNHISLETILL